MNTYVPSRTDTNGLDQKKKKEQTQMDNFSLQSTRI
jgi:hypothetical protein